jgi:hypothetical protein
VTVKVVVRVVTFSVVGFGVVIGGGLIGFFVVGRVGTVYFDVSTIIYDISCGSFYNQPSLTTAV